MSYNLVVDDGYLKLLDNSITEGSDVVGYTVLDPIPDDYDIFNAINMMREESSPITINFCQLFHPNTSISILLGRYFTSQQIDYIQDNVSFLPTGDPCKSIPFLYGVPMKESYGDILKILEESEDENLKYTDGRLVQIHYTGKLITQELLTRCCTSIGDRRCSNITTQSSICNVTLKSFCQTNPESEACYRWLINSRVRNDVEAYNIYSSLCKTDMNPYYCTLMCHLTREEKLTNLSSFCDVSLTEYCKQNPNDKNCLCSFTRNKSTKNIKSVLKSPRVCWDVNCSNDPKWILFEDLIVKRDCKLLSCEVTLNNIDIGKETKLEIENSCIAGNKVSSKEIRSDNNIISSKPVPFFLNWDIVVFVLLFLVIVVFFMRRSVNKPQTLLPRR